MGPNTGEVRCDEDFPRPEADEALDFTPQSLRPHDHVIPVSTKFIRMTHG
eukprot:gene22414-34327_t